MENHPYKKEESCHRSSLCAEMCSLVAAVFITKSLWQHHSGIVQMQFCVRKFECVRQENNFGSQKC